MLAKSLQIVTGLLGTAIRSFAFVVMLLEISWGVLLAGLCFWVARQGSAFRGILAAAFALLAVTACTLVIALYFACLSVVRKAVLDAGLGRTIFESLFDYSLGVSGKDTGGAPSTARIPTHMSQDEVKKTLNKAAKYILSGDGPSTSWARPFWRQPLTMALWHISKTILPGLHL